jgi:acyl-CoA dehydrogenase
MSTALVGGIFVTAATSGDETAELRQLVDHLGAVSFDARLGHRGLPEEFDEALWRHLQDTGLSRLTSTPDLGAGPTESAIVLRGLARCSGAVPIAETDVLAAWLGAKAGIELPDEGPMTVAIADADADVTGDRVRGIACDVPWTRAAAAVLLAVPNGDGLLVRRVEDADVQIADGRNLAGEPRDTVKFDLPASSFEKLDHGAADELTRRGAWARCVQITGALDAAAKSSVSHTRERVQFGRSLSKFQTVQHALAGMAGEIERARAAATLAVAATADHGFDSAPADYAVTIAKITLGQVVPAVATVAHQLHGAIGVTIEHQLWLSTARAHSWIGEFGSTGYYARRLGTVALAGARSGHVWDVLTGSDQRGWA